MAAARQPGISGLLVPAENAKEAEVAEGLDLIPIHSLSEAFGFLAMLCDRQPPRTF